MSILDKYNYYHTVYETILFLFYNMFSNTSSNILIADTCSIIYSCGYNYIVAVTDCLCRIAGINYFIFVVFAG